MNIFKQFYRSLFSPKDIARFRFQGIGKTILYVFFLVLISTLPTGYYMASGIVHSIESIDSTLGQSEHPSFSIEDGVLTSSNQEPYLTNYDDFMFIIDSSGKTSLAELSSYPNSLALLENQIVLTTNYQAEPIDYSMFNGITLTDEDISSFIGSLKNLLPLIVPIMLVIMYLFTAAIIFIQVTILALIGLLVRNILGVNLRYRHTWVLSAYSITLATLFFTIMETLQILVPYGGLLNWFISTMVLFLSIKEIPVKKG